MSSLIHLECGMCGEILDADKIWNLCPKCNKPLLVRYDLEAAKNKINPDIISRRAPNMWRYREVLPVKDPTNILTLGEGFTPLHHAQSLGRQLEFNSLYIKDEGLNPTGSFKARGLCMAVSKAKELGITSVSIPSAGNAAGAMSAYASLAGMASLCIYAQGCPSTFYQRMQSTGGCSNSHRRSDH